VTAAFHHPYKKPKEYTDMARTLYIVDETDFTNLPKTIRDTTLAETTKLLTFIQKYQVKPLKPDQFPAALDFTDSVFRLGADEAAIAVYTNSSSHQQWKNAVESIKKQGIKIQSGPDNHVATVPDQLGKAFMSKEVVTAGSVTLAVTITGGTGSLKDVQLEVVQFLAGGDTLQEIDTKIRAAQRKFKEKYEGSLTEKELTAFKQKYDLMKQALKDWPQDLQIKVGVVLARVIAHEARHQYVGAGHATAALGAVSADIIDDKNYGDFSKEDKGDITNALTKLEQNQKGATLIETNVKGQTFPF
jgi:hypothetical protein